jgi:hypothetical protein
MSFVLNEPSDPHDVPANVKTVISLTKEIQNIAFKCLIFQQLTHPIELR